jgi:hypothetical protein
MLKVPVYTTKAYRQVDEKFHSFLTLARDGGQWSSAGSNRFTPSIIEQEAGSVPEPVWTLWETANLLIVSETGLQSIVGLRWAGNV